MNRIKIKYLAFIFSLMPLSQAAIAADLGTCTPEKMALAASGDTCRTERSQWRVEPNSYFGYRVYRDLNQKHLTVTALLSGTHGWPEARRYCSHHGFRLPSGYLSIVKCDYTSSCKESDYATLTNDGVVDVVQGMKDLGFDDDGRGYTLWTSYVYKNMAATIKYYSESDPQANGWEEASGAAKQKALCVGR